MVPIFGETREEAWIKAIDHLRNIAEDNIEYNLIMEISKPTSSNEISKFIRKEFDTLLSTSELYSVHTVAETIFPLSEYRQHGLRGITEVYPDEIFPEIKSSPGNSKGTYALRIVRGKDPAGNDCRPLEAIIDRLKKQINKKGIRCAYELSLEDVQTIPINRNDSFLQGFPCLSHLSFKLSRDRSQLHLTAIYRSHYYIQKALGNLLGLARLQHCIANELGINVGKLVCHSTLAHLDNPAKLGKKAVDGLINSYKEKLDESE